MEKKRNFFSWLFFQDPGKPAEAAVEVQAVTQTEADAPTPESFCTNCGKKNETLTKFCLDCGHKLV